MPMNTDTGAAPETNYIQLNIPAKFDSLAIVGESLRIIFDGLSGLAEKESIFYNTQLAAYEVCTNIIKHSYQLDESNDNRIWIELRWNTVMVTIKFEDTGVPFKMPDPSKIQPPLEPDDHGYGLFLIHSLVDKIHYGSDQSRNTWLLVKNLK
jgi:anti-sigma regulatory factor (Ser/Thr protein kinase)